MEVTMIPYIDKVITRNLVKEALFDDVSRNETLMIDEKCQLCGRELGNRSRQHHTGLCGTCTRKQQHKSYCISELGYRLNHAHGMSFFNAFDIVFDLETIKPSSVKSVGLFIIGGLYQYRNI